MALAILSAFILTQKLDKQIKPTDRHNAAETQRLQFTYGKYK